jgi:hypothetical protein
LSDFLFAVLECVEIYEFRQKVKGAFHADGLFTEDNFVAALFDFEFFAFYAELLRKPDGLAVSGFEDSGSSHWLTSSCIYVVYIHLDGLARGGDR